MGRPDISPARLRPTTKEERNSTGYCVLSYKFKAGLCLYVYRNHDSQIPSNYERIRLCFLRREFKITMSKSVLSNERFLRLNKKVCHISKTRPPSLTSAISTFLKSLGKIDQTGHHFCFSQLFGDPLNCVSNLGLLV
jgi:hypothetical protein